MDGGRIAPLSRELLWVDTVDEDDWLAEPCRKVREEGIDPRKFQGDPIDCGWIGETDSGIWLKRHPEAALAEMPSLWWASQRWSLGQHEITRKDFDSLSGHEMEQLATLNQAHAREMNRRAKRGSQEEPEDSH